MIGTVLRLIIHSTPTGRGRIRRLAYLCSTNRSSRTSGRSVIILALISSAFSSLVPKQMTQRPNYSSDQQLGLSQRIFTPRECSFVLKDDHVYVFFFFFKQKTAYEITV